jgi:hypothetical protein
MRQRGEVYKQCSFIQKTLDRLPPFLVSSPASGVADFRGVTGGVYKARERIHRDMLIRDY